MGKVRNKNRSEVEFLRGENKKLRAENIRLRRENKHHERRTHFYEDVIEDVAEDLTVTEGCKACGKGQILIIDLGTREIHTCDICQDKKVIKKQN